MRYFVITILRDRSDLTEKTLMSFYKTNSPDVHIFIDNASTDNTKEVVYNFIEYMREVGIQTEFSYSYNIENEGIAVPFTYGINFILNRFGLADDMIVLKLDNDITFETESMLWNITEFYKKNGVGYVVAPRDIAIDPAYEPNAVKTKELVDGFTPKTHVGGACLFLPARAAKLLSDKVVQKDVNRGAELRKAGYTVGYIDYLKIEHIGLNKSTDKYKF